MMFKDDLHTVGVAFNRCYRQPRVPIHPICPDPPRLTVSLTSRSPSSIPSPYPVSSPYSAHPFPAVSMALSGFRFSSSLFSKRYPHHSLSAEQIIEEFSSCGPDYLRSKVRAIDWHPHTLKLVRFERSFPSRRKGKASIPRLQLQMRLSKPILLAVGVPYSDGKGSILSQIH